MILKKNFDLRIVIWNIRYETGITLLISCTVWALHHFAVIDVALPFSIAAILGSALAIFIAFRNQSAYARWWEARTIWGGIVNNSRIFGRQVIANAVSNGEVTEEIVHSFKQEMIYRQIAFAHALRLHLRRQNQFEELRHLLNDEEYNQLLQYQNKPNMLLQKQGKLIKDAIQKGILGAFDNISMEPNLASFNNWQGACERIKNTPLPRNYHYFTRLFMYVFMFVFPLCIVGDFFRMNIGYLVIPVSYIICFVFAVMNRVGEINEEPFENKIQDTPMTALCNTIERDLKEMLGESNLPPKIEPVNGFLF